MKIAVRKSGHSKYSNDQLLSTTTEKLRALWRSTSDAETLFDDHVSMLNIGFAPRTPTQNSNEFTFTKVLVSGCLAWERESWGLKRRQIRFLNRISRLTRTDCTEKWLRGQHECSGNEHHLP